MPPAPSRHRALTDERGVVLILALVVLVGLAALGLTLLSLSALEPQISRNHADMLRARYLAEAGLEHAYDVLAATTGSWSTHLAGATCTVGAVLAQSALPGLGPAFGQFTVRIRNDCAPGDERMTFVPAEPGARATTDANGTVVVQSTGAVTDATHTVVIVVSSISMPVGGQSGPGTPIAAYSWSDE